MRAPLFLIALALTACGERAPSKFDILVDQREQTRARVIADEMKLGKSRQQAEQLAIARTSTDDEIRQHLFEQEQKEKELAELRAEACKQQPYRNGC